MSSPSAPAPGDVQVLSVVPVLRMYDVRATIRFYTEYLGCSLDWQDGEGDRPVYLQVSRDGMRLHLSSHHDDGTPGTAVLVVVRNLDALHAELHKRRSEEHTSELQSPDHLVCRLLLEKKKKQT